MGFGGQEAGLTQGLREQFGQQALNFGQQNINPAVQAVAQGGANQPRLNTQGLFEPQQQFATSAVRDIASRLSGNVAARGGLSDRNAEGIAGSALTAAAPAILPMISQNIQGQRQGDIQALQALSGAQSAYAPFTQGGTGQNVSSGQGTQFGQSTNTGQSQTGGQSTNAAQSTNVGQSSSFQNSFAQAISQAMSAWQQTSTSNFAGSNIGFGIF